jgi:UPF0176 protein
MEKPTEKLVVILFYKYINLDGPITLAQQQKICESTQIKGRVLLGDEGINGTLAGTRAEIDHYIAAMRADERFADIDFKESEAETMPFPKLKIKYRKEIVTLGLGEEDVDMNNPKTPRGNYLNPDEMKELLESDQEYYLVDARDDYESKIGKFKDAIEAPIQNFREFPAFLETLEHLKDKKVVFYCTGGIRCEKATAFAIKKGFKDVHQLHGGIHRYAEKYPEIGFEGAMYVFDNRIVMRFNKNPDRVILTKCMFCEKPSDDYKNCYNSQCNARMVVCDDCYKEHEGCCSEACKEIKHPRKTEFIFQEKLK